MSQSQLPGTEPVAATYECGYGREHSIPSERVRILRMGTGFVAHCACGGNDLDTADEKPHHLGDHTVILAGVDSAEMWLVLDRIADGWQCNPDSTGVTGDKTPPREAVAAKRAECEEQVGEQ